MTDSRSRLLAVLFVCIMSLSVLAPIAGAAPTSSATATADAADLKVGSIDDVEPNAKIHQSLQNAEGTKQVIVRLEDADLGEHVTGDSAVSTLQEHADSTQNRILRYAAETDGVTVENRFWITNAVLLSVDTDQVDLADLAGMAVVTELHANFDVEAPSPRRADAGPTTTTATDYDTTYGLDQVNATEVWETYGTKGDGVTVAVLDTGVDASHPDIDLYTEDDSDPTYPGGWAEFDENGDVIPDSEPADSNGHGTHTSGTVAGGNDGGQHIGVAPDATLIHGGVLTDDGGTFAAILAGMEWAVQEDADVMSMSLGCIVDDSACYTEATIDPIQNAEAAGTIVIASAGNDGEGFSSSPGNVYDAVSIGASNENYGIAEFSSGMTVNTSEAWGDAAPDHWPDSYVVPDVAAPGVGVTSAQPGGGYADLSGTSMSAPHVAGVVALMESAAGPGSLTNDQIRTALVESAWKPDGEPAEQDTRYGHGLVDAKAAVDMVALEQGITGTVTGPDGEAIVGASVDVANGGSAVTDDAGTYSVIAANGTYDVTADAFGYTAATESVTVDGDYATQNFTLSPELDVAVRNGQTDMVEGGENVTMTVEVANLEAYTAELADGYSEENATLYLNGQELPWGQTVTAGEPYSGTLTLTVETTADTSGSVAVDHTIEGLGDTVQVTTGPTEVFPELTEIAVVDDSGSYGADLAETLDEELPAHYRMTVVDAQTAATYVDAFDAMVVQNLAGSNADEFVNATADPSTGVVYLDNWGSESNAIPARADVLGDPGTTEYAFGDGNVSYEATTQHPILDGVVAPGERVQIHAATTYNDHSWFDDTDAQVLADLHTADAGVKGVGLAVDESRRDVLASSLGRETYVGDDDFTAAGDAILANAVVWAAGSSTAPGTVDVTETTVEPGASGTVTVQSSDLSDVAGYQAKLTFDPDKLQVTDVSGVDLADPVVTVDNENGVVYMAQAQASGVDDPAFVEVEFDVLMDDHDASADIEWVVEDSMVADANGDEMAVEFTAGAVHTTACAPGDVNKDGEVNVQDATLVQQFIVGQEPESFEVSCADMNDDGQITSADVTLILEAIVGSDGAVVGSDGAVVDSDGAVFDGDASLIDGDERSMIGSAAGTPVAAMASVTASSVGLLA